MISRRVGMPVIRWPPQRSSGRRRRVDSPSARKPLSGQGKTDSAGPTFNCGARWAGADRAGLLRACHLTPTVMRMRWQWDITSFYPPHLVWCPANSPANGAPQTQTDGLRRVPNTNQGPTSQVSLHHLPPTNHLLLSSTLLHCPHVFRLLIKSCPVLNQPVTFRLFKGTSNTHLHRLRNQIADAQPINKSNTCT